MTKVFAHKAQKRFGQNFLIDPWVIQKIIEYIAPKSEQKIIEIGPGFGAITKDLLNNSRQLIAVEIDRNLCEYLNKLFANYIKLNQLILINQDLLQLDLIELPLDKLHLSRVVGNLPYNIASPVIFKLFEYINYFQDFHFLLQKEFAERLVAKVGTKQYGRLSVMAQYHSQIKILLEVPPTAFKPIPKVYSSLVKIEPYYQLPVVAKDYKFFSKLVQTGFMYRRKILVNCFKQYCTKNDLINLELDPILRPEQLSLFDFVKLSNYLT